MLGRLGGGRRGSGWRRGLWARLGPVRRVFPEQPAAPGACSRRETGSPLRWTVLGWLGCAARVRGRRRGPAKIRRAGVRRVVARPGGLVLVVARPGRSRSGRGASGAGLVLVVARPGGGAGAGVWWSVGSGRGPSGGAGRNLPFGCRSCPQSRRRPQPPAAGSAGPHREGANSSHGRRCLRCPPTLPTAFLWPSRRLPRPRLPPRTVRPTRRFGRGSPPRRRPVTLPSASTGLLPCPGTGCRRPAGSFPSRRCESGAGRALAGRGGGEGGSWWQGCWWVPCGGRSRGFRRRGVLRAGRQRVAPRRRSASRWLVLVPAPGPVRLPGVS